MAFSATGLAKKDVMSQSDPFLAALKRRPIGGENDWVPVFKTEASEGAGRGWGRGGGALLVGGGAWPMQRGCK